jgi:hypothetical protein
MKARHTIPTLVGAATLAIGAQAGQAAILMTDAANRAVSSQTTLSVQKKAGTSYHASAKSAAVRPDDRAGSRGV